MASVTKTEPIHLGSRAGEASSCNSSTCAAPAAASIRRVFSSGKPRIGRLDQQEEPIRRRTAETLAPENRLNETRQPVQRQHAKEGREGAEQNDHLERHGDVGRQAEQRLAADHERIVDRIGPPLAGQGRHDARQSGAQDHPRQDRRTDGQRFVQAVHREGRKGVDPPIAFLAHLLGRRHQVLRRLELGQQPDQLAVRFGLTAHVFDHVRALASLRLFDFATQRLSTSLDLVTSSCPCASTDLTSAIATIGR